MSRTAGEAGWHESRYNLAARIPDSDKIAVANLFRGTCGAYTPIEMFLLDEMETLDENHPMLKRFKERGLIVNFDELAALTALGRMACLKVSGAKHLEVTWFGGEPLLMPDVIEALSLRLMALAQQYGAEYEASIVTNGYLLTQETADMLGRCKVAGAQITLDGIGTEHDRTRHLAGGGSTYDRIVENLRILQLPFKVNIRHNVYEDNRDQIGSLRDCVRALAEESGNKIGYYASPVQENIVSEARNGQVNTLRSNYLCEVDMRREIGQFHSGRGVYCGAQHLFGVGIDDQGNLFKCWEDVDKPERSFGRAGRWDPADPITTADRPDQLTQYLNTALPMDDLECRDCKFLPQCAGGCPTRRVYYQKQCLGGKGAPERYVLGLYERLLKKHDDKKEQKGEQP